MEGFDCERMDENWTGRAKTRYNRTGWNVNQWKRGDRVGVNGIELDKPAQNKAGRLRIGQGGTRKSGKGQDWM